jgi:hypothetical protein
MQNPKLAQKRSCFVIMPFGDVWDDYYTRIYSPAISEAGLMPVRADDVFRAGSILQDIVDLLRQSIVVLADITETNRNVHYELGLAHALGKPTVLVAPRDMNLFFDVGQERMVTYTKGNAFWGSELQAALVRALQETVQDPASAIPTAFMHLKPSRVEADEAVVRLRRIEDLLFKLLRNAGGAQRDTESRWQDILKSPAAAEEEAERLLKTMDGDSVIQRLMSEGYRQIMAESAVATAQKRRNAKKL